MWVDSRSLVRYLALAILCLVGSRGLAAHTVIILSTDTLTSTERSISGAKSVIRTAEPGAVFHDFTVMVQPARDSIIRDSISAMHPDIILTNGSAATEYAKVHFPTVPKVFCSVMYPVVSGFVESYNQPGGNITGASLTIPADLQFRYFKQIVPTLKRIGLLYTDVTAPLIPPSRVLAQKMGLELIALKIGNEKEIPAALDSITRLADGIWSLADPTLFSPQSTKFILVNALRRGKPLMGFSRNVVESGALFALDLDYKAVGRQAGEIVTQILKGTAPQNIGVTTPDIIWFHYNAKTAEHMKIKIPDELVAVAREVYR